MYRLEWQIPVSHHSPKMMIFVIYVPSSATPIVDKQQLKLKFKLAILDDIENKKDMN
jgi:hypothetical protein